MKKTNILLLSILIFLFIILGISLLIFSLNPYKIQEIPILLEIGEKVGINVNTTAITFSVVMPGTKAERILTFTSNVTEIIKLYVKDVPFVYLSVDEIIIHPNEEKTVTIIAAPPKNAQSKNYTGKLLIISREQ
mgnify:CR=1 FL=1